MFEMISEEGNLSALQHGIPVVTKIIECLIRADKENASLHKPSDSLEDLPTLLRVILESVDPLITKFFSKEESKKFKSSAGRNLSIFGFIRLHLMRLIYTVFTLNYTHVTEYIIQKRWHILAGCAMFIYDHNSFCNYYAEKITDMVLNMSEDIVIEFLKKTEIVPKIVDADEKYRKSQNDYKECMANCLNVVSNKLDDLFEKNKKMNDELLKGATGRGWNAMMRALKRLQRKLKQTEIPVDKSQPRGKLVVADEEGFNTESKTSAAANTKPTKKVEETKPSTKAKASKSIDLDAITDEDLLKMDLDLDLNDLDSDPNLDDLLAEEEEPPEKQEDVMSAIEAILDGGFDQVVMDKGKLQTLKMDDLKG